MRRSSWDLLGGATRLDWSTATAPRAEREKGGIISGTSASVAWARRRCLLIEPFPESALNEEAGRLLMEDYEAYATHARLMTSIHAQPPKRCPASAAYLIAAIAIEVVPWD